MGLGLDARVFALEFRVTSLSQIRGISALNRGHLLASEFVQRKFWESTGAAALWNTHVVELESKLMRVQYWFPKKLDYKFDDSVDMFANKKGMKKKLHDD
jgi:hypothetical protein